LSAKVFLTDIGGFAIPMTGRIIAIKQEKVGRKADKKRDRCTTTNILIHVQTYRLLLEMYIHAIGKSGP
jgi:hypothetical protein